MGKIIPKYLDIIACHFVGNIKTQMTSRVVLIENRCKYFENLPFSHDQKRLNGGPTYLKAQKSIKYKKKHEKCAECFVIQINKYPR